MPRRFELASLAFHDSVPSLGDSVGAIGGTGMSHAASPSPALAPQAAVHAGFCEPCAPVPDVCADPALHRSVCSLCAVVQRPRRLEPPR